MQYEKKVLDVGESLGIILPLDLCKYLGIEKGTEIVIQDDEGKHGRFISIWRKDSKKGGK